MSSETLQSVLADLRLNNCVALIIITACGYDYILTLRDEIEYIWANPWTYVSTLFVLVRYAGICTFVLGGLRHFMSILSKWAFFLFLGAADFVMMLRVWAMYDRSRLILGIVSVTFLVEMIGIIVFHSMWSDPRNLTEGTIPILNSPLCTWNWRYPIVTMVVTALRLTHGTIVCILAIIQSLRQSLQMYRVTKRWQINRYMNLLVRQGVLYFVAINLVNIIQFLSAIGEFPSGGWSMVVLFILDYVPAYTLAPRFILSIRALYARDVQCRRGTGIDTGFGLSSSHVMVDTMMEFADVERSHKTEVVEEVPVEVKTTRLTVL